MPGLGYRQLPDQAVLASLQAKVLARFGTQKDVTASLDAVILDDGTLLGPDTRNAGPHVQGKVDAYRDIADQLLNAIQDRAGVEALAGILVQNATYVAPLKQLRTADEAAYNRSYWGTRKSRSLQYSMVLAKEGLGALSRLCQTTADRELPTIHR
ncbi:MAG TPA: hypothetical protein VG675_12945 [Bryobacteraceae bacterium]|nr:hypothetical protein [Bryobacteraceae bacterium]